MSVPPPVGSLSSNRTLRRVALWSLAFGAYAGLAVWKEATPFKNYADIPAEVHAALTLVIGWLLVFRTNVAFQKWWEARSLWGAQVNASRNVMAKVAATAAIPRDQVKHTAALITAFVYVLRDRLLNETSTGDIPSSIEPMLDGVDHTPGAITAMLYTQLDEWKSAGWIDEGQHIVIDRDLSRFLDVCGGCEKIKNTPLSISYRQFSWQCVFLLLITMPWGIVNAFQWWTIPLTAITGYFMLGLETVAEHMEDPFGREDDDLDLDTICQTIARNMKELSEAASKE